MNWLTDCQPQEELQLQLMSLTGKQNKNTKLLWSLKLNTGSITGEFCDLKLVVFILRQVRGLSKMFGSDRSQQEFGMKSVWKKYHPIIHRKLWEARTAPLEYRRPVFELHNF
jgi:hypothetical protein